MSRPACQKRNMHMFWTICIPLRLGIGTSTFIFGYIIPNFVLYLSIYTGITTLGFISSIFGKRTHGGFGGKIWWSNYRYVHVLWWCLATVFGGLNYKWSGVFLLVDALFATVVGISHYNVLQTVWSMIEVVYLHSRI